MPCWQEFWWLPPCLSTHICWIPTRDWTKSGNWVFTSVGDFCLPADEAGIRSGVTTVVEAGITFPAFCATVASTAQTRVYALILTLLYIATADFIAHRLRLAVDWKNQDLDRARAVIEAHRQVVVGLKARPTLRPGERESPTLASALILGEEYRLPIMIHLGRFPMDEVLDPFDLLDRLRSGEIVSNEQKARARDYALQVVEHDSSQ